MCVVAEAVSFPRRKEGPSSDCCQGGGLTCSSALFCTSLCIALTASLAFQRWVSDTSAEAAKARSAAVRIASANWSFGRRGSRGQAEATACQAVRRLALAFGAGMLVG